MKVNARYNITNHRPGYGGRKRKDYADAVSAVLIGEYEYFYLFQGKNYRFTVSKAALHCGHYRMRRVGAAA